VIWFAHEGENLCWIEMKTNLTTHSTKQFTEELEKALRQVQNTLNAFKQRWEQQGLTFSQDKAQSIVIAVHPSPNGSGKPRVNFS